MATIVKLYTVSEGSFLNISKCTLNVNCKTKINSVNFDIIKGMFQKFIKTQNIPFFKFLKEMTFDFLAGRHLINPRVNELMVATNSVAAIHMAFPKRAVLTKKCSKNVFKIYKSMKTLVKALK